MNSRDAVHDRERARLEALKTEESQILTELATLETRRGQLMETQCAHDRLYDEDARTKAEHDELLGLATKMNLKVMLSDIEQAERELDAEELREAVNVAMHARIEALGAKSVEGASVDPLAGAKVFYCPTCKCEIPTGDVEAGTTAEFNWVHIIGYEVHAVEEQPAAL